MLDFFKNIYNDLNGIKKEALSRLKGNWIQAITMVVLPAVIIVPIAFFSIALVFGTALAIALGSYSESNGYASFYILLLIGLLVSLLTAMLQQMALSGFLYNLLDMVNGKKLTITEAINGGFSGFSGKYIKGTFIITLERSCLLFLWYLITIPGQFFKNGNSMILSFIVGLIFSIPFYIKSLSYSQAILIFKNDKDSLKDGEKARFKYIDFITRSRKMMDGEKVNLFSLVLSFIGWMILLGLIYFGSEHLLIQNYNNFERSNMYNVLGLTGILILVVASIFLIVYMTTTLAVYYNHLVEKKKVEPESVDDVTEEKIEE